MKTNILTKLLFVLLLSFSAQGIFITTAKADVACTIADNVMNTSAAFTSVRCTMQPEQLRMYPYNLYLCTALPAAPTTTSAIDLTACSQIYSNPDGDGYVDISSVGNPSSPTGGTLIQPPAGVFTHVVLEAKNVMGLQGYFISDGGRPTLTGTHASPGTGSSGGYCYTVAGSYTNSILANARCGEALGDYGMALVTMNCFDDICRSAGTLAQNDSAGVLDGQWDRTAEDYSAIPGNDWQYSPNNGGGTDGATNIPTTDADGVSRTTYFYYTNYATKMLCAGTTVANQGCLATIWDVSDTSVKSYEALDSDITTSMFMVQVLPTAQGNGTLVPTGFNMNFKIATAMIYEAKSDYDYDGDNDDDYVAFRMGPLYLDFNLEF